MNYDFINSDNSLSVLAALTPLVDSLSPSSTVFGGATSETSEQDRDNCVFAIANLLKGKSQNCAHFIKADGPKKLMEIMLQPSCSIENVDLVIGSLKSLSD